MPQQHRVVALAQAFAVDTSSGGDARVRCAYADLEPQAVLEMVRGCLVDWAMRNVPGTRVELVGGALVGLPS